MEKYLYAATAVRRFPGWFNAYELGVSWKTIEVHRANAMRKMQANSLSELVGMVLHLRAA
ncbi:LuxR C-terminal-related transcriptional regulator [Sulfuriferula plumbiphila]|uniref:LuxR C-terminal-related transcriptional regulator n=1 Tax=Sulfuriferula plumbiphila TaxID=171865 RepID=UPI00135CF8FB|nr:LuxR C-terminal-related transcriptional regulator [Sulfuriferula plumbiphila]BBP04907.1 hypothetical protein SFPGR_23290 [Sulfuriferula plumbiphila]